MTKASSSPTSKPAKTFSAKQVERIKRDLRLAHQKEIAIAVAREARLATVRAQESAKLTEPLELARSMPITPFDIRMIVGALFDCASRDERHTVNGHVLAALQRSARGIGSLVEKIDRFYSEIDAEEFKAPMIQLVATRPSRWPMQTQTPEIGVVDDPARR